MEFIKKFFVRLGNPMIVARFQQLFGVRIYDEDETENIGYEETSKTNCDFYSSSTTCRSTQCAEIVQPKSAVLNRKTVLSLRNSNKNSKAGEEVVNVDKSYRCLSASYAEENVSNYSAGDKHSFSLPNGALSHSPVTRLSCVSTSNPVNSSLLRKDVRSTGSTLTSLSLSLSHSAYNFAVSGETAMHISDSDDTSKAALAQCNFCVENYFWYYLAVVGGTAGDEIFYITFFPLWIWNVDAVIGRLVIMVWTYLMYIGQALKDVIRWPRPASPPVARLEKKWVLESGMPSTHAMVALAVPFAFLYYSSNKYQFETFWYIIFCIVWCIVVCCSRIYLGMHSFADVAAGFILASFLLIFAIPGAQFIEERFMPNLYTPLITTPIAILSLVVYPGSDKWTPARGDTAVVLGVCFGIMMGTWIKVALGQEQEPEIPPPYPLVWPSYAKLALIIFRTVLGVFLLFITRAIVKTISYSALCKLLKLNKDDVQKGQNITNNQKLILEVTYKFITYTFIGINTLYFVPFIFEQVGIA